MLWWACVKVRVQLVGVFSLRHIGPKVECILGLDGQRLTFWPPFLGDSALLWSSTKMPCCVDGGRRVCCGDSALYLPLGQVLTVKPGLTSDLDQLSCFSLPGAGTAGICHHSQL